MRYHIRSLSIVVALVGSFVAVAEAQRSSHIGPRISYQFDVEEAGLGAQLSLPISRSLDFYPSLDNFFVSRGSLWSFNADFKGYVGSPSTTALYLGAGINVTQRNVAGESRSRSGLNLLLGIEGQTGLVHPFAEFRLTSGDGSSAQLAAGLNFRM
jgi:hypothetical protein